MNMSINYSKVNIFKSKGHSLSSVIRDVQNVVIISLIFDELLSKVWFVVTYWSRFNHFLFEMVK
jgi:hypothetical protein